MQRTVGIQTDALIYAGQRGTDPNDAEWFEEWVAMRRQAGVLSYSESLAETFDRWEIAMGPK